MKRIVFLVTLVLLGSFVFAQVPKFLSQFPVINYVEENNFYLLYLIQQDDKVRTLFEEDAVFSKILLDQRKAIQQSVDNCSEFTCITAQLQLNDIQIQSVTGELQKLYPTSPDLQNLVKNKLIPSGAYDYYQSLGPLNQLLKAWQQDAAGINHALSVYANGTPPWYPDIDSISFNVHSPTYINVVRQATKQILIGTQFSKLFFMPSITSALFFLHINGRDNAGDYEPMATTVNRAAVEKIKTTQWSQYPYVALMVPGEGPDDNAPISPGSKARCRLAAGAYHNPKMRAPFIIVSGGKVHPYKTKYCEAEEMKQYLIDSLGIPDSAIIMEPHSRHTTTNMRNSARLLIQYNFPTNKAALVISDSGQIGMIQGMKDRCLQELGDVPYKLGNLVNANSLEFYAVPVAQQINFKEPDPLDP